MKKIVFALLLLLIAVPALAVYRFSPSSNNQESIGSSVKAWQSGWFYNMYTGGKNLLWSATAPTISSGFGTSPSIAVSNGTASFTVNVGTGGTATNGVIGLPAASHGWNCSCNDLTSNSTTDFVCKQTAGTTTSATIGEFSDVAVASAWTASDIVGVSCLAY